MDKKLKIIPSFFDRFEKRSASYLSIQEYKHNVMRDIAFLLNTLSHFSISDNERNFERVKSSVLSYGCDSFIGNFDKDTKNKIVENIKEVLLKFEPRFLPDTLEVTLNGIDGINYRIDIVGSVSIPVSNKRETDITLTLKVDIETGRSAIKY